MKKKKILLLGLVGIIGLSFTKLTYAYFSTLMDNSDAQNVTVQTGNLELTFLNGNGSITGTLGVNQSIEKTFSIRNDGTYPTTASILWKNLNNTYTEGSLVYKLEYKTTTPSDINDYPTEVVSTTNVPRSTDIIVPTIVDGVTIPANTTYYYKLTITLVDLPEVNQNTDLNATFYTEFIVKDKSGISLSSTSGDLTMAFENTSDAIVSGTIAPTESVNKNFSIANETNQTKYAKINLYNLVNTYSTGDITYTITNRDTNDIAVSETNLPVSSSATTTEIANGLEIPANTTVNYTLTFTNKEAVNSGVKNNNEEVRVVPLSTANSKIDTKIVVEDGESIIIKCLTEEGTQMACPTAANLQAGQRIVIGNQLFRYIRTTNTSNTATKLNECGLGYDENWTKSPYTIACDDGDVRHPLADGQLRLLAEYNLNVGSYLVPNATEGLQNELAKGYVEQNQYPDSYNNGAYYAITNFSDSTHKGKEYPSYAGSLVESYINAYVNTLNSTYFSNENVISGSIMTKAEVANLCNINISSAGGTCSNTYPWLYSSSYWLGSAHYSAGNYYIVSFGDLWWTGYNDTNYGVRPVISIDASLFE